MDARGKAIQMQLESNSKNEEFQQRINNAVACASLLLIAHGTSQPRRDGSVVGRQYKNPEREAIHQNLMKDYFIPRSTFDATDFRRRFRMKKELFYTILNDVVNAQPYFFQKKDGIGRLSLSLEQKITSVFRMLAYGCSTDSMDEYLRLPESTTLEALKYFCSTIEQIYVEYYLRSPNQADLQKLLHKASRRGFPGMLAVLTACTGNGKTIQPAGVVSLPVTRINQRLSLRQ